MHEDDKIAERNYGYNELVSLPTLHEGHFSNLKIEGDTVRVSLSRCGPEDGASRNDVTVERLINGLWVTTRTYRAVRVRKNKAMRTNQ